MLVVPAMAMALAGCSGDDDDKDGDAKAGAATDTATATETATATTTSPPDLPVPPTVGQSQGGVEDVEWDQSACETSPGEQTVTGTLTNPTRKAAGYLVTISWTNATSDTLGLGYTIVRDAKPDQEVEWEVKADVGEGAVQCVINVQRGVIKK